MATIHLQQPEPFQFQNPDGWPKWKRHFEQFRVASGLATSSGPQQVSTLLYCLGPEAEDVLLSTNITEEGRKVYETVLKQFDDFFKVRVNQTLERAKFNNRSQKEGETADEYITTLYSLALQRAERGDDLRQANRRGEAAVGRWAYSGECQEEDPTARGRPRPAKGPPTEGEPTGSRREKATKTGRSPWSATTVWER